jgi:tRNA dimethylallyltransferase
VVAVVGTNASGKSELAVELAKVFDGEIVSADSRQVYRDLDIGTGKLTEHEMQGVPHHLLDVADAMTERFSLADYQQLAYEVIDDIQRRGRLPLLAGGTGLYVRAIVEGYELVAAPPNLQRRAELEGLNAQQLSSLLAEYDPLAANGIDPRNRRRIIRAIEILEQGVDYPLIPSKTPRYDALQLGVTWPPAVLRVRIEARLARRLREGMVEEVTKLMERGISVETLESLGLEYRHIARMLTGRYRDEEELFEKLGTAIYRFSRRQLSWFRKDDSIIWLDTGADYLSEAIDIVQIFLSGGRAQIRTERPRHRPDGPSSECRFGLSP